MCGSTLQSHGLLRAHDFDRFLHLVVVDQLQVREAQRAALAARTGIGDRAREFDQQGLRVGGGQRDFVPVQQGDGFVQPLPPGRITGAPGAQAQRLARAADRGEHQLAAFGTRFLDAGAVSGVGGGDAVGRHGGELFRPL
ncbi:hypothetical protein [Ramlibacter algicola]|uniref:Uncharacterized protein n=1 Tax=Ramlibacter algicola TaxID=2795217 RepID=A0A934Q2V3_9BURK|nr:hypothetical protein [Ramlibacter algicola]MBK0394035.1 hypothetical protein [Ramlibacter algicola]